MSSVVLYGFPQSTYVRTARLACEEKDVAYTLEPIEFDSPAHRALHPFARMPALKHGEMVLYETGAITRYVDEHFDGPALQPSEATARAQMNQWISIACDYGFGEMIRGLVLPRLVFPGRGEAVDEAAVAATLPRVAHLLSVAERALADIPYLAGDALTLADLFLAPQIFWLGKTREGSAALQSVPAVDRWFEALSNKPSFAATVPPMPGRTEAA